MTMMLLDRPRGARVSSAALAGFASSAPAAAPTPVSPRRQPLAAQWRRTSAGRLIQTWSCVSNELAANRLAQ
jgi:hypothetical protein